MKYSIPSTFRFFQFLFSKCIYYLNISRPIYINIFPEVNVAYLRT
jgi:hypothetical protein